MLSTIVRRPLNRPAKMVEARCTEAVEPLPYPASPARAASGSCFPFHPRCKFNKKRSRSPIRLKISAMSESSVVWL